MEKEVDEFEPFKIRTVPEKVDGNREEERMYVKISQNDTLMTNMKQVYKFPFIPASTKENQFNFFKNSITFDLVGTNPIDLDYSIAHHVFKFHVAFRAKLYECFENNDNEFPFEWQFLNVQMPYRIDKYAFQATVPKFVIDAFCFDEYWSHAVDIWSHSILARKRDSVDEWKLLNPWLDLRHKRLDYGYEFYFGLIKYRVCRNPNYYMLEIIIPLFLMVSCVFHVLLISWDDENITIADRLSFIITLLLAVAAFQISIVDGMPYKSQFTLIDQYFLLAYSILVGMVIEQSLETTYDDRADGDLSFYFGGVLMILWIVHSSKFVFKYITYNGCKTSFDCSRCTDWCRVFNIISCGIADWLMSLSACFIVICCCCKRRKRKIRMKRWMEMEKSEAASWDNTRRLKAMSHKAELILGTNKGAIYSTNEVHELKYNKSSKTWKKALEIDDAGICNDFKQVLNECKLDLEDDDQILEYSKLAGLTREQTYAEIKKKCQSMTNQNAQNIAYKICHSENQKLRKDLIQELRTEEELDNLRRFGCFCGGMERKKNKPNEESGDDNGSNGSRADNDYEWRRI